MKKRALTGLVMAIVLIPLLIIPQLIIPFQILMLAGVVVASLEFIKMFNKDKEIKLPIKIVTVILTIGMYLSLAWFSKSESIYLLEDIGNRFIAITMVLVIVSLIMLVLSDNFVGSDVGKVLTTTFYIGLGLGSLVVLRLMGLRFIAYLLLITVCTDVFAYLFGVKFGKHKMSPKISPKKSWEGAIAGTIVATIVAGSFALFYGKIFTGGIMNPDSNLTTIFTGTSLGQLEMEPLIVFVLTIGLSILGQLGDLVASKFKRTYDIKDFGNIFPGHGGVMDRFDSAMFASMFLVVIMLLITI